MSRILGNALTSSLLSYLQKDPRLDEGRAIFFLTNDPHGWPHVAMLSLWEMFATDEHTVKVATYATSASTSNLKRDGRATIILVASGNAYYIKGSATLVRERLRTDRYNSLFELKVDTIIEDAMEGVRMTGIEFEGRSMMEQHGPLHEEISGADSRQQ